MPPTRLIGAEGVVDSLHLRNVDRKSDIDRGNDVVDTEVAEPRIIPKLLEDAGILSGCQPGIGLAFDTSDDHFARGKDESSGLGFSDAHDGGSETLGVILGVAGMQCNRLQVKSTVHVDGSHDILQAGNGNAGRGSRPRVVASRSAATRTSRSFGSWLDGTVMGVGFQILLLSGRRGGQSQLRLLNRWQG